MRPAGGMMESQRRSQGRREPAFEEEREKLMEMLNDLDVECFKLNIEAFSDDS